MDSFVCKTHVLMNQSSPSDSDKYRIRESLGTKTAATFYLADGISWFLKVDALIIFQLIVASIAFEHKIFLFPCY